MAEIKLVDASLGHSLIAGMDFPTRQPDLKADKLGAVRLAVLVEPVGQDQAGDVIIGGVLGPLEEPMQFWRTHAMLARHPETQCGPRRSRGPHSGRVII